VILATLIYLFPRFLVPNDDKKLLAEIKPIKVLSIGLGMFLPPRRSASLCL